MNMKKKKKMKAKRHMRLRDKIARFFKFSWVRFEELPREQHREDDEEISHLYRMF